MENLDIDKIIKMSNGKIKNYIVPGLSSYLIGDVADNGSCVRMLESKRHQHESVVPHSHRFDFVCVVISGYVKNTLWEKTNEKDADQFAKLKITKQDGHEKCKIDYETKEIGLYRHFSHIYRAGESYSCSHDEIHSIEFGKNTKVLFFRGPTISSHRYIIQPIVDGDVINTLNAGEWVFGGDCE